MASFVRNRVSQDTGIVLRAVVWLGLGCLVVGMAGQIAALFPTQWSRPEWEVAYFGEYSATLAVPVLGLVLVGAASQGLSWSKLAGAVGVALVAIACWSIFGSGLVALDLPLIAKAAGSAATAEQQIGIRTVGIKAVVLSLVYGVGSLWMGAKLLGAAWRR